MKRPAWRDWFHITFCTYGQWLPGDSRSWRTRHHRDHIPGNYKTGRILERMDGLYGASRQNMVHAPVILLPAERRTIGYLLLESFGIQDIEVIALAVTMAHIHILARLPDLVPRTVEGKLKQHATRHFGRLVKWKHPKTTLSPPENAAILPESPWRAEIGRRLWAARGGERPIADRVHHVRAFRYIVDHVKEGGWVWTCATGPLPFRG